MDDEKNNMVLLLFGLELVTEIRHIFGQGLVTWDCDQPVNKELPTVTIFSKMSNPTTSMCIFDVIIVTALSTPIHEDTCVITSIGASELVVIVYV